MVLCRLVLLRAGHLGLDLFDLFRHAHRELRPSLSNEGLVAPLPRWPSGARDMTRLGGVAQTRRISSPPE